VSQSSAPSEATKWLVQLQTSRSPDLLWPAFEEWLVRDQEHWEEFVQAQRMWLKLDYLTDYGPREHSPVARELLGRGDQEADAWPRTKLMWLARAILLLILLLMLSP
jgi:ferric-dicitrate binding protein FerR (iron transport regulator)